MKILHIVNHTGRHNGNVHAAIDLACAQADLGHDVSLCSSGGHFDDVLKAHKVTVIQVDDLIRPASAPKTILWLRGLLNQGEFEIIHAHMMKTALLGYAASRLTRTRLVTTVHNAFEKTARIMALGDRVIAVSGAVRKQLQAQGFSAKRLRMILNGTIGTARFSKEVPEPKALQRPALLYLGGLHPRKGIPELLEGFSKARRHVPTLHLHLVGEGPCQEEYEQSVSPEDRPFVHFLGSTTDPRPYTRSADALILVSRADPAPLVLSEAREAGLAIIGTRVDGIPELLDNGDAGLLIEPQNPEAIEGAIVKLFQDPSLLAEYRRRGGSNLEKFSVSRVARETIATYRELKPA